MKSGKIKYLAIFGVLMILLIIGTSAVFAQEDRDARILTEVNTSTASELQHRQ